MTQPVLIKVYGNIFPADKKLAKILENQCKDAVFSTQQETVISLFNDLLTISFEGIYFPLDEILSVIQQHLLTSQKGKIDYIDIENWCLDRYLFINGKIEKQSGNLNNIMDYSGH